MDTQILPLRLLHEAAMQKEAKRLRDADRARALAGTGAELEEDDEDDEDRKSTRLNSSHWE